MLTLYNLAFYAALLGLGLWFFNRERAESRVFQLVTLAGLALMLLSLTTLPATAGAKFSLAFRDLLLLGGAGFVFGLGIGLGRRVPLWVALLLLVMGTAYFLRGRLIIKLPRTHAVEQTHAIPGSAVDPNGEWLVELADNAAFRDLEQWTSARGINLVRAFYPASPATTELDDYYVLDLPAGADAKTLEADLQRSGLIDWLEPNEEITITPLPAEPLPDINRRFGVNDPAVAQQWAMEALDMDRFYSVLKTKQPRKRAVVAILDTGVDSKHEDLSDNYRSIRRSYDDDPKGHGTHCAGIAGAVTNNGIGVASMAADDRWVEITSVKVLSAMGMGTQKSIIDGIIEAADAGVDVISMSLGGFSNQSKQRAYGQAVAYAAQKGAIVVAAAGNANREATSFTPVNAPGVIGVSAIDQQLLRATFSNRVNGIAMAVAAPGVAIHSTVPGNDYKAHSGTSMATPFVAGLVGMMKSIRPELDAAEAFRILNRTGRELPDGELTGKLIQPAKVLEAL